MLPFSIKLYSLLFIGVDIFNKALLWESVIDLFCCTLLYGHSSLAIILMWKRQMVALLSFSSWCLVIVVWLLVPWVYLQFVIVVFPDHTHYFYQSTGA